MWLVRWIHGSGSQVVFAAPEFRTADNERKRLTWAFRSEQFDIVDGRAGPDATGPRNRW